jgi:hypothetical protein
MIKYYNCFFLAFKNFPQTHTGNLFFIGQEESKEKSSKWIYSSKFDEMKSMKKGRIYVTSDTGNSLTLFRK